MPARALWNEMTYGAIARRERPVAWHIPYTRHVDDLVLKTEDDMVLTIFKLDGYCFETADISEINNRLMGRNDIIRTLANSRFAAVAHVIRREVEPKIASTFDNDFCRELDERYDASLARKRMFVNDVYLTIVRRKLQGHAGTFESLMARAMGRKTAAGDDHDLACRSGGAAGRRDRRS